MKIATLLITIPVVAAAGVIAVANRQEIAFSLDPFAAGDAALTFTMPLYVLVFLSFFLGVLLGGLTALVRRSKPNRGEHGRGVAIRNKAACAIRNKRR